MLKFLSIIFALSLLSPQEGWLEKAQRLFAEGNYSEALAQYRLAQDRYPSQSPSILYNIGQCYLAMDSTEAALTTFYLATSQQAPVVSAQAFNQVGVIMAQQSKYEQSLRYFKRALRANPMLKDAAYNYELVSKLMKEQEAPKQSDGNPDDEKEDNQDPSEAIPQDDPDIEDPDDDTEPPAGDQPPGSSVSFDRPPSDDQAINQPKDQVSMDEARRILEGMRDNELRFLQQLKKSPIGGEKEAGKPDW